MRFIWSSVIRVSRNPRVFDRSQLYLYVSGYGISAPGSSAALLAVDAGKGMWGEAPDLQACAQWYIDHGPFFEVIILADCCRSRYRDVSLPGVNFDKYDAAVRAKAPNVTVAYAAAAGTLAFERRFDPDESRGRFTEALLYALDHAIDSGRSFMARI